MRLNFYLPKEENQTLSIDTQLKYIIGLLSLHVLLHNLLAFSMILFLLSMQRNFQF